MILANVWHVMKTAAIDWHRDNAPRLGAAIAYYAIFSIAPLLVIATAIAGSIFGAQAAKGEISAQIDRILENKAAAQAIEELIKSAAQRRSGELATILSFFALWFGASGVFGQIKGALDVIWEVERRPGAGIVAVFIEYAWSVAMVAAVGILLLASLVVSSLLTAATTYVNNVVTLSDFTLRSLFWGVSIVVLTVLFAATFKFLPDVRVRWRDVWVGAIATAILFSAGKYLIGWYLARSVFASVYGAAGSFALLLIWTYYSAQIFLYGGEIIQAYAELTGAPVRLKNRAQFSSTAVKAERRAQLRLNKAQADRAQRPQRRRRTKG